MTKNNKKPITKLTPKLQKDIYEMYRDGVPCGEIADWFGVSYITTKKFLSQYFRTDIYGSFINKYKPTADITLPKITEPDLFACQLALLKSIGDNAVREFFDKVRENYPTVTLVIENNPPSNDFYTTPELEPEIDIENDYLLNGNGYDLFPLESSQDYNRLL